MATSYPLSWPVGVPRTPEHNRTHSRFKSTTYRAAYGSRDKTVRQAFTALQEELRKLGASNVVVSTNIELKANGEPYSRQDVRDPGAAAYFQLDGRSYSMPCDRWGLVADNIYAIAKHIEAMRGQLRWGVASVEQAFAGFKALPENIPVRRSCFEILGIVPESTRDEIREAHRKLVAEFHPDRGGSTEKMAEINAARDEALRRF